MAKKPSKTRVHNKEADAVGDRLKDAPFAVDTSEDGDMATPKPALDEQDVKDQEERGQ